MLVNHHRHDTENGIVEGEETELWSKIEKYLSERVKECIENCHFFELPSSVVYRIFEKNSGAKIDSNKLVDIIFERIDERFIFFRFVELHQLREDKIEFVIENYVKLGENKKKYFEYMPIDILILKETREKMKKATNENESNKAELEQMKTKFIEKIEREKKCTQRIIVGGFNNENALGENSNNKAKCGYGIISPPVNLSIDPSSFLSYAIYSYHSVAVTRSGSLLGVGYNNDGRISSSLTKAVIKQFSEFSIDDGNGHPLAPISAVCTDDGTLYMFTKSCGSGKQLVLCDREIKDGAPVFLSIGNSEPVSIFGGRYHFEAICSDGKIIFIDHYLVKKSSYIAASSLPNGEKATMVASFFTLVFALSSSGRIFVSDLKSGSSILSFSSVSELSGEHIIWLSGKCEHCLAVSSEGRVFGRRSNKNGQLGLGKGISEVHSFTLISSLSGHKIRAAYAGSHHSLFETQDGKILACGCNRYGELLLSSGPSEECVYSPTETTISKGATFCIAGEYISSVFIGVDPPPNTPNMPVQYH